jgi:hypothetical protein
MDRDLEIEDQVIKQLLAREELGRLAQAASRVDVVRAELQNTASKRLRGSTHAIYNSAYDLTIVTLIAVAIAVVLALLLSATQADAQSVICSSTFANSARDTLTGFLHVSGDGSWSAESSGREGFTLFLQAQSGSEYDYKFSFKAQNDNDTIQVDWFSGDVSCYFYSFNVDRNNPPFTVFQDVTKDDLHKIGKGLVFMSGVTAGIALSGCGGDGFTCGFLSGAAIFGSVVGGLLQGVDPWDDAYSYTCEPSFSSADDLGVSYLGSGYGNWVDTLVNDNNVLVSAGINMKGYLECVNTSIDRANSCAQIDAGCQWDRAAEARQFLQAANQNACNAGAALYEAAYQYEQNDPNPDYIDAFARTADQFWAMCNEEVQ